MNTYLPTHFHQYLLQAQIERHNSYLCMYCDLFLSNVKKALTPVKYDTHNYPDYVELSSYEHSVHPHWPSVVGLLDAADEGCHICSLFASQLTPDEIVIIRQNARQLYLLDVHGRISLEYRSHNRPGTELSIKAVFYMPNGWYVRTETSLGRTMRKSPLFFNPLLMMQGIDTTCKMPMIQSQFELEALGVAWLKECSESHHECKQPLLKAELFPARLIFVGTHDDEVRLCTGDQLAPRPRYVTLSHTWGGAGLPADAKNNSSSTMESGINVKSLPQTFRDAISFTRKLRNLGVEYVWIDALCILQDSEEDFSTEGSKMFDIYGNSVCTLAVGTGTDSASGFFVSASPYVRHVCSVQVGSAAFAPSQRFKICNNDVMGDSVRNNMLRSRAWCFQELILSRRILYFVRGRVTWECGEKNATSEEPDIDLRKEHSPWSYSALKSQEGISRLQPGITIDGLSSTTVKIYQMWSEVIRNFSGLDLSRNTDRHIAIAGIAKQMHQALDGQSDYLVGLWSQYIHTHLLWKVRQIKATYRQHYQAPSWSWCSVNSNVYNHRIREEGMLYCSSLITARAELHFTSQGPFSNLKLSLREECAILRIRGPLFEAHIGGRGHDTAATLCPLLLDGTAVQGARLSLDFPLPGPDFLPVLCLITTMERFPRSEEVQLAGLLLVPHDKVFGRYLRIGLAFVLPHHLLAYALATRITKAELFEESFDNGEYTVSLS